MERKHYSTAFSVFQQTWQKEEGREALTAGLSPDASSKGITKFLLSEVHDALVRFTHDAQLRFSGGTDRSSVIRFVAEMLSMTKEEVEQCISTS
ncbi:hypothetical protein ADEAN_000905500 [Angomonas deanei]|uniref:Uncharacterized protein n=1 Tax=Angomonas deanei TaxID=59799 RepID=A0A7G2CSX6_9TRYP|nr:hypothetical protein ADEAN_000905500 [Angomonas deanei]